MRTIREYGVLVPLTGIIRHPSQPALTLCVPPSTLTCRQNRRSLLCPETDDPMQREATRSL